MCAVPEKTRLQVGLTNRSTGRDASVTRLVVGENSGQAARQPLRR